MDSILSSAVKDGSFVALESLMLPFGFYRSKGFIFDNGIRDRRPAVRAHSFTNQEDKVLTSLSEEVSRALADVKSAANASLHLTEEAAAKRRVNEAWNNLKSKTGEKEFPLKGYGYPASAWDPGGGTLLMTWNPNPVHPADTKSKPGQVKGWGSMPMTIM